MKYNTPFITFIASDLLTSVKTQGSGDVNNGITPSDPDLICNTFDCDSEFNTVAFEIEWDDDAGSDVNGYTVRLNINGDTYDIKDQNASGGSSTCDITESPAGTYILSCSTFDLGSGDCDNCDTYTLVSITDGFGNVLLGAEGDNCEIDNC
jgi:hypothetical protein